MRTEEPTTPAVHQVDLRALGGDDLCRSNARVEQVLHQSQLSLVFEFPELFQICDQPGEWNDHGL